MLQTGRNLVQIRTQKGWSVEALAILSGVDEETIRTIESGSGDFYLSSVYQIAAQLNVDFRHILVDPTDPRWQPGH
jgi:transcriptional regulator with XRE-family HTH domain